MISLLGDPTESNPSDPCMGKGEPDNYEMPLMNKIWPNMEDKRELFGNSDLVRNKQGEIELVNWGIE